jgi:hypothetical protein
MIVDLLCKAYYDYIEHYGREPKKLYLGQRQKKEIKEEMSLLSARIEAKYFRGIPIEWTESQFCLKFE